MSDDVFSRIIESARAASLGRLVETEANLAADRVRIRAERLERYRETLPDDDYQRIIRGDVDSQAWRAVSRALDAYRAGRLRFLWLCGGPGTGKTVAFANAIAEIGGMLVYGPAMVRTIEERSKASESLRYAMAHCGVLVLDDLGTSLPQVEESIVLELVNQRQGGACLTLITGNQTRSQIEKMDPRIMSRIQKQGAIVELGGADMRRGNR